MRRPLLFALLTIVSWNAPLYSQEGAKPTKPNADSKDLCSYLKDIDSKTDADCGEEVFAALQAKDPAAYAEKLGLAQKRKPDVLKAYEFLKTQPSPDQQPFPQTKSQNQSSPIQIQPPINERTFPAWIDPEAKDLKEVYTRWLQAQDQQLQQERQGQISPERRKEIDAALAANHAKIAGLQKLKDPSQFRCFLGESCGGSGDVTDPAGQVLGTGKGSWTTVDYEKANTEAKRQNLAPGGKLDRGVPSLVTDLAAGAADHTPIGPLFEKSADRNQSPLKTAAELALVMTGTLMLAGGLAGSQIEEKFPGIRKNMGIAALLGGVLATGVLAWRALLPAAPLLNRPDVEEEASESLPAAQQLVQRVAQSAPNVAPQASAGLQQTAVLEQQMVQEFSSLRTIGQAGSSPRTRLVDEGVQEAQTLFQQLSRFGKSLPGTSYPGKLVELPNGARVGFRLTSTSGPPTIDVHNFPGFAQNLEIKFLR